MNAELATDPRRRAWLGGAISLAVYLAAAVFITWPLSASLATHLPSPGFKLGLDRLYSAWCLAWQTHALTTVSADFADANIFHPTSDALFYGPTGTGSLPYFAPIFLATGNAVLAINVTLIGCLALCAWTTHLAVRHWTSSELAGFVAGAAVLSSRWLTDRYVPSVPHVASLHFIPVLMLLSSRPFTRWGAALLFAPIVALQCATELVYVTPAVLAVLGVLCTGRILRAETRGAGLRLLAATALGVAALWPLIAGYRRVAESNPDLARQSVWFWFPPDAIATRIPIDWLDTTRAAAIAPIGALCILAGILAAAFGRNADEQRSLRRRGWRTGALWAAVGVVLSLGASVQIGGTVLRAPLAAAASWFPALERIRVPDRLGAAGLFGLAVLLGVAFAECEAWLARATGRPRWTRALAAAVALAIGAGMYFDWGGSAGPPPSYLRYAPPSAPESIVARLRADPGPLLELPIPALDHGVVTMSDSMFRSTLHWSPLVAGYSSYYPANLPWRLNLARNLPDPRALDELRRETGLRYVWVHADQLDVERRERWTDVAARRAGGLELCAHEGDDWLFVVQR